MPTTAHLLITHYSSLITPPLTTLLNFKVDSLHLHRWPRDVNPVAEATWRPAAQSTLVPVDDAKLAHGRVLDLELPVFVCECVIRMVEDANGSTHPRVNRTLERNRA